MLVMAKCPNCGQNLQVDPTKDAAVCEYCGTPFIVEKAVNNYNTFVTNNVTNNINANTVILGKNNIESLKERGMQLIFKKLKDHNHELTEDGKKLVSIADDILREDPNNFYGHYFLVMAKLDTTSIIKCFKTSNTNEQEMISRLVYDSILLEYYFLDDINDDIIGLQIERTSFSLLIQGVIGLKELSNSNEKTREKYDQLLDKMQTWYNNLTNVIVNSVRNFFFSADNIKNDLPELSKLVTYCGLAVDSFKDYVEPNDKLQDALNIVETNRTVIMANNPIYGKTFIKNVYELAGKELNESEMAEATKVVVSGCWLSKNRVVITLYNDKIVFNSAGVINKTIYNKDIFFINLTQYLNPYTLKTTLWYDVVFRLSENSYSLLHYGYDMEATESFYDCAVYSKFSSWMITNNIKHTETKYEDSNPFTKGYNGLTYVDSQPPMAKGSGCYVATCVYGSYDCPEVWVLRRFRDYKLAKTWYGRLFIKVYYAISPTLVKWFGKTNWFKNMWRGKLNRMVKKYKKEGFEDTPYNDIEWK